ncbi:hypothetical protein ACIRPP_17315 [Streptomyces sp. NPDC101219]|uniref:hypothetical protein n=1 Tax=Streptomyces sp. NPDC101219 TaxID=3366131 RepID=UPI0037F6DD26
MDEGHRAHEPQWGPRAAPRNSAGAAAGRPVPPPGPVPDSRYGDGSRPPQGKRRRVFLWVFLAVQILFLVWVIWGASTASGTPEACRGRTGDDLRLCNDASDVGTTIGVGLVIALWAAVDVILGFTYLVYRLASRRA